MQEPGLAQWVEVYTEELYSWAFHKISDEEIAKDLVQDTFLAAVEKFHDFKEQSTPKTWLFAILNNKIVDHYRKKIRLPGDNPVSFSSFFNESGGWNAGYVPLEWKEHDGQLLDNDEFVSVLNACLNALPEKWNLCVKLKYLLGKNGKEICKELGIKPTNLWQIIHRAKLQLRDCVEKNWYKE
ncbi:MAG: sigma-70 family RNA polymerase sigma factor [Bacteroidota bacterium]